MAGKQGKAQVGGNGNSVSTRLDKLAHDKLLKYTDDNKLASMSKSVMILLDIADKCKRLGVKVNPEPSVTIKGG